MPAGLNTRGMYRTCRCVQWLIYIRTIYTSTPVREKQRERERERERERWHPICIDAAQRAVVRYSKKAGVQPLVPRLRLHCHRQCDLMMFTTIKSKPKPKRTHKPKQHYMWKQTLARPATTIPGTFYPDERFLRIHLMKEGMPKPASHQEVRTVTSLFHTLGYESVHGVHFKWWCWLPNLQPRLYHAVYFNPFLFVLGVGPSNNSFCF